MAQRERSLRDPLGRLFPNMPHGWRVVLDWVITIAGAVAIVLAVKAWVVNPYRIPSSSGEISGSGSAAASSGRRQSSRSVTRQPL